MATIKIDTSKQIKKMKPLHAGGQPPVLSNAKDTFFHYLTEAGIPYSRLHDVGGAFGGGKYVDIPNIFRDFDADVSDPASYDFTFTDLLLEQLHRAGVEPYFRLGVTIENAYKVKNYQISPPKDYDKWARVCEHIIRHYTEGWADGYRYKITYWEIWGEPEQKALWQGTAEEYYRLYDVTAKHLKGCFGDKIKVGGYGATGFYYAIDRPSCFDLEKDPKNEKNKYFVDFFHGFLDHIKQTGAPIDFFSWHSYATADSNLRMDKWVGEQLALHGYGHIESHLNEYDPYFNELGTAHHAAEIATTLIGLQHGRADVACIYDMRIANAPFCPLFNCITSKPIHAYYVMVAFNTLYKLGMQAKALCDTENLYVLLATNGKKNALFLANATGKSQELCIEGADLTDARWTIIDNERLLSWSPAVKALAPNDVVLVEW